MPVRYGGVTYPNLRYGGVNYPNVRYGGVTYPLAAVPSLYSTVTVNLSGPPATAAAKRWQDNVDLGSTFAANGLDQELNYLYLNIGGSIQISITGLNNRFTPEFEATGRIIITASDGEVLEVTIANADLTETYDFTPTNSAEVTAFFHHVVALTDQTATLTLTDEPVSLYSTVTVNLTGYTATATQIRWDDNVALPPTFDLGGNNQTLSQVILRFTNAVSISILGTNRRWTPEFEATGRLIFTASDGETLEVMIANADMTEPYAWTPTNGAEITLFVAHVRALADHDATLTLTDEPVVVLAVAPAFADDTGDAQAWTQNTAIAPITVPAATGDPVPTYAAVDLPSGITFDADTRVISGTPTTAGSGTATVTATNDAGTADWTVAYTIAAALTLRQRLVGVDGGSGNLIDVTLDNPIAGGNADQHYVYEHTPSHGTLNYVFPAAMFAEPTIFWNERPRFNHNGGTGDEYIVALQRGGSSFDITPFLTSLPATWAWYVINVDTGRVGVMAGQRGQRRRRWLDHL